MRTNHLARAACVLGRAAGTFATFAIVMAAAACSPNGFAGSESDSDRSPTTSEQGTAAATHAEQNAGAAVQGVATFTAADVARIVIVLEQSSVDLAQLAEQRATTVEVKTYAARIVRERTESMNRLAAILERTTPRSNDPTAPLFEKELSRSKEWLLAQESSFDLPFMTGEMGAHARILGMLEASLLPSAAQATDRAGTDGVPRELEDELVALRTQTSAQMIHALRVQGVLRAGNAPVDETTMTTGGSTVSEGTGGGTNTPH
jgi:predicted outer membrane protein